MISFVSIKFAAESGPYHDGGKQFFLRVKMPA